jgi:hypothetical protein
MNGLRPRLTRTIATALLISFLAPPLALAENRLPIIVPGEGPGGPIVEAIGEPDLGGGSGIVLRFADPEGLYAEVLRLEFSVLIKALAVKANDGSPIQRQPTHGVRSNRRAAREVSR